jgi:hypothetical protein
MELVGVYYSEQGAVGAVAAWHAQGVAARAVVERVAGSEWWFVLIAEEVRRVRGVVG